MKKAKQFTDSVFWARHLALAMVVLIIAALLIFIMQTQRSAPRPEGDSGPKSLAQNMSDFYEDYRLSSQPDEEKLGDFVIRLKETDSPLGERLQKMESLQKPLPGNWSGENKHRSFSPGSTLRGAITEYAQSEGMQLIWELDKDFIVKYQFQLDNSLAGSLQSIGNAIDSSFTGTVRAYVCPKQRSLVITAKNSDYLQDNCQEVGT